MGRVVQIVRPLELEREGGGRLINKVTLGGVKMEYERDWNILQIQVKSTYAQQTS